MKLRPSHQKSLHLGTVSLVFLFLAMTCMVGCENSEVQTAVLGGLNDLAVTLVDALFLAVESNNDSSTPVSWIIDTTPSLMC